MKKQNLYHAIWSDGLY